MTAEDTVARSALICGFDRAGRARHRRAMLFEFATATRIVFGPGTRRRLPELATAFGRRALIVTGAGADRHADLLDALAAAGVAVTRFRITGEPTTDEASAGTDLARACGAELVIALGGGSVIDAGKAIAALACQPAGLFEYLEVIGQGQPLDAAPLPFLAMPTTAGTGAEVTRNAVLASPAHRLKASLRHASMLPALALVDPELTLACPPSVTAASGMDALTQCLEAFVSCRAQPLTDALCREGIRRAAGALERAVADGGDLDARSDLALAALFSGLALANAGLGAVHGFAAPLGGRHRAPHGAVCAALLAPVWEANLAAVHAAGDTPTLAKFREAAVLLTGDPDAVAEAGTVFLRELTARLRIPGLAAHGLQESDLGEVVRQASAASSMKGNPVPLGPEVLAAILRRAL
jgi:alcohol dehydrogenase class IV